jgi:hypothetical protein
MNDKQISFVPFHAINQFMLDEFRQQVIRSVLTNFEALSANRRKAIIGLIKKLVSIPGFRDASQAPLAIKLRGVEQAFEKKAELTAQILMAWSELKPELGQQVHSLLSERSWEVLPLDADRTRIPGFLPDWPKDEDYDTLDAAFAEKFPQAETDAYDFRLMVVWVSGRLPYNTN